MKIKAISFNPLQYEVNGMPVPVVEKSYLDENGVSQSIKYLVVDGEKLVIQMKEEILTKVYAEGVDEALVKVEAERLKKIEDNKDK